MKINLTKYLALILLALFFISTNELNAKEAEQNFRAETHIFIGADYFGVKISLNKQNRDSKKNFTPYLFFYDLDSSNNYFTSLSSTQLKFVPHSPYESISLKNSIFLI